jgi:hypothetical protein
MLTRILEHLARHLARQAQPEGSLVLEWIRYINQFPDAASRLRNHYNAEEYGAL